MSIRNDLVHHRNSSFRTNLGCEVEPFNPLHQHLFITHSEIYSSPIVAAFVSLGTNINQVHQSSFSRPKSKSSRQRLPGKYIARCNKRFWSIGAEFLESLNRFANSDVGANDVYAEIFNVGFW